ncbi:MAG: hypothetical protein V4597_19605 [Pseudomonadota bacterium]
MIALLNALAVLALAAPAQPPPDRGAWMAIRNGEYVAVEIHPDGGWRVLDRGPVQGGHANMPKDTVVFALSPSGQGMMLSVQNSGGQPLNYRATLRRRPDSRPEPTSVCTVLNGIAVMESWPYPIAEVDVGEFQLVTDPRQPMVCK